MNWGNFPGTGGPVVVGAGDQLDQILNQYASTGSGPDILVGAGFDQDLQGLGQFLGTSGQVVVGAENILVETGGYDPVTGAPQVARVTPREAQLIAQIKQLQGNQRPRVPVAAPAPPHQFGAQAKLQEPTNERYKKIPLPLDSESLILANESRFVRVTVQMRAKPKRLIIDNPEWWRVKGIFVGNKPQTVAQGSIPGVVFSYDATSMELIGDTAAVGQQISVEVENKSGADKRFEGAFECHVID